MADFHEEKKKLEAKYLGKKVMLTNTNENAGYFIPAMEPYKKGSYKVVDARYSSVAKGYVLQLESLPNSTTGYWFIPSWLQIVGDKPEPEKTVCRCNIFRTGCICGVFKAEKAAKEAKCRKI